MSILKPADRRATTEPVPEIAEAPLVDAHAHIYKTDMPMAEGAWHRPPTDATAEDYLATLDNAGVHFGVLAAASIYGDYNDYMLESVREHARLRATVIVEPDTDPYTLRRMKADGVVGIRLQFRNVESPPDLGSAAYQRLLQRVADLGWHVHLHDEGERLPQHIAQIEKAGPRLVIDHFGRPQAGGGTQSSGFRAVLDAVQRGRTWVKLSEPSGWNRPRSPVNSPTCWSGEPVPILFCGEATGRSRPSRTG